MRPRRPVGWWLVERAEQIGAIDRALEAVARGEGRLVVIQGPAGIGKTALLEAARERSERAGARVLSAMGTELEAGFPYGVIRQLLEPTIQGAVTPVRERLLAGSAGLAAPAVLGPPTGPADPAEAAFAVVHGLYWLVANLADEAPAALLVDDAHWSDAPSLRFLAYLACRLEGLAVAVIASIRTGERAVDESLLSELQTSATATVLTPPALSEAGVASVLAADFGHGPSTGFARACHRVTAGVPFFVRELAATLIADRIDPTDEAIEQISTVAPQTIARVTLARLGRLSKDAVELARAIAVLGGDARLPRAAALARLKAREALVALDTLIAADVLSATGGMEFRHPIVHAAIYEELAPGARSLAHRHAAALLATEGEEPEVVAGHLLRSEPVGAEDTIATLRDAAQRALALGAPENASVYLARALQEGAERELRSSVLLELAQAEKLARRPAAIEHFAEVARLTQSPITRGKAIFEQALIRMYADEWQPAMALLDEALAELTDRDQRGAVQAETVRAMRTAYDPRLFKAFLTREPMLRELVATRGAGTRPLAFLLAVCAAQRDDPAEQVRALVELGWDDGRYLADAESVELLPHAMAALVSLDELDRAAEIVDATRAAARTNGSVMHYLVAIGHDAWIHARCGNLAAAAGVMRDCIERAVELALLFPVAVTLSYCADVLLERPDVADLAAMIETIELGPLAESMAGAMVRETRGRLRFAAGDRDAAIADLRHAAAISDAIQFTSPGGFESWRSTLALMLGPPQRDEALTLTNADLVNARRIGQPRRIGIALRALGTLEPDSETRRSRLEEAVAVLAHCPARLEHARALVELGAARRRHGDRGAARVPLRDALDLATRCGAVRLTERARTELAATGARPRRERISGRDALTPSELRVAQMAADGHTSQEIAQALFVTTRTIDTHLNHTYTKLGINSRKQLPLALASET